MRVTVLHLQSLAVMRVLCASVLFFKEFGVRC
jgi:hypothetical protein